MATRPPANNDTRGQTDCPAHKPCACIVGPLVDRGVELGDATFLHELPLCFNERCEPLQFRRCCLKLVELSLDLCDLLRGDLDSEQFPLIPKHVNDSCRDAERSDTTKKELVVRVEVALELIALLVDIR